MSLLLAVLLSLADDPPAWTQAKPGEFPLSSHTTVLHGLALAGGLKEFAKADNIVIVREDQSVVPVNYKRISEGKDVSQNVALARGDTIVVP